MELEITPEPSPDERAAIEAAMAEVLAVPESSRGAWWQAGVLDSTDQDAEAF